MSLKNIREKIVATDKTRKVTRAMEAVSAIKMRNAIERAIGARVYARSALRILGQIADTTDFRSHPLRIHRAKGKIAIVLITSDKGLAGSLNSGVLKAVETYIAESGLSKNEFIFLCVGKRGYEFALHRGYKIVHHEDGVADDIGEREFRKLTTMAIDLLSTDKVKEVRVAYSNFLSTFEQVPSMHKILPLSQKIISHIVDEIVPATGAFSSVNGDTTSVSSYTIEPNTEEIIDSLLPKLVNIALFHKVLEAKASEHSARMVAMKSATDKGKEMSNALQLQFNKARQAAITAEVSEITGGIEALKA